MKPTPAHIVFDADGVPTAPAFGDVYHARAGASAQARHVFLGGNGLPARWQGRARFVVLETGFGLGNNFLETWAAWRGDARRPARLHFVSVEKHPALRPDLERALAASPHAVLAAALVDAWPPPAPGLHRLGFDDGAVVLDLLFDDIASGLKQLRLQADAFYLDGFAPARNPAMWDRHVLKGLGRLAAPGATAATWSVARDVRDGLVAGGFEPARRPGFGGKREMSVAHHVPRAPRRDADGGPPRRVGAGDAVIVVGAGLAGAACAQALAAAGCRVTVLERAPRPAAAASGNPAGLFHGVVHSQDGPHARLHRAAALLAARRYAPLLHDGRVPGRLDGLLRLAPDVAGGAAAMRSLLDRLGLPPGYVQALDAEDASARAGLALTVPAWWFPGGGWLAPQPLVEHGLATPGVTLRTGAAVAQLADTGDGWAALDAAGATLAAAPAVVLCGADDTPRLLGEPGWPLQRQRGQLSIVPADAPGLPRPDVPIAGGGYALTLPDGRVLCGATSQPGDADPTLRDADHDDNLARLRSLTGWPSDRSPRPALAGRTAFRLAADDRLPLVGAVPQPGSTHTQARRIARRPGLFVCTAFGSRGITWAPLAGELLAAIATGAPLPLEAALADALDPARFAARAARREDALSARPDGGRGTTPAG